MDKNYDHKKHEGQIYELWEKAGVFAASGKGKPFTVLMPPPNANASLHAGHAMYTIDDIVVRLRRMQGFSTQWIPGLDHAGFETQYVYEKQLAKEGKSRMDFDRQTLYDNVYKFVKENSGLIYSQFKRLGFSADWNKSVFTLDSHVVSKVFTTFKKMEEEGFVYRDEYIINYCPHCGTSLAELEVDHIERVDKLYYVKYPLVDNGGFVIVATTRPEPIWVDTHLAVNPNDTKNKNLIGKKILNPLTDRVMQIISDEFVDPEFGTGVVKLTPAHDANDFAAARKHSLPIISAIDPQGKMMPDAGKYAGLKTKAAREAVVADLSEKGLIEKIDENYNHSVSVCYKCGRDLEPMTVPNWFIKVDTLKKPALEAIKKDRVKFYPNRFKKQIIDWLTVMHDWPISRQIAWGIRIPIWYSLSQNPDLNLVFLNANHEIVSGKGHALVGTYGFEAIEAGLQKLIAPKNAKYVISENKPGTDFLQETDTFDTWFSSGQWPLVTGAPLPTDFLGTLADILKFWVSRMVMFSLYLENQVPFKNVYLWSMVTDAKGAKMSKSKGNVVNPIEFIDKYGADALRMTLVYGVGSGGSVPLSEDKVRAMRNFSNKIWNAARFVNEFKSDAPPSLEYELWFSDVSKKVTEHMEKYQFGQAAELLYDLFWHDFCDRQIEMAKDGKISTSQLKNNLITCLKLLHPFMPFVTEAVWRELKLGDKMLIESSWPSA